MIYPLSFNMAKLFQAMNGKCATQLQYFSAIVLILLQSSCTCFAAQEILRGFSAVPDSSFASFQPLLKDQTGNFSLGFLRMNRNQLALAVLHVPSSEPFWLANPNQLAAWSDNTELFFNGSLVISDHRAGISWSTDTNGERVVLLNTSNLQVQTNGDTPSVLWQSFHFPTNTLVENQNFTSNMSLISSNGLYALRLGNDFMGLYAKQKEGTSEQLYWKHTALEAKAQIVEGQGPLYAQVNSDGYLAMYQASPKPVDVQKFDSFQRPTTSFLLVRIEPDGNLKGYYWDGSNWVFNYEAITETCELPSPCGAYGLCTPGGPGCSCLNNRTSFRPNSGCFEEDIGDLCGEGISISNYLVLRKKGVESPHKELLRYETTSSLEQCENWCEKNCSCWGALYNNATGFCYIVDYPIQTMLGTGDESKVGYFKVRKGVGEKKHASFGLVSGVAGGAVVLIGAIGFGSYMIWNKRKRVKRAQDASPGPYKNLGSASFRSVEMSNVQ